MVDEPAITVEHDDGTLTHEGVRYVPEDRWQPIETAPRDGTQFLAYRHPFDPEVAHVEGNDVFRFRTDGGVDVIYASHWQPLPAPPKDA